jgi:hypothetical protein
MNLKMIFAILMGLNLGVIFMNIPPALRTQMADRFKADGEPKPVAPAQRAMSVRNGRQYALGAPR